MVDYNSSVCDLDRAGQDDSVNFECYSKQANATFSCIGKVPRLLPRDLKILGSLHAWHGHGHCHKNLYYAPHPLTIPGL